MKSTKWLCLLFLFGSVAHAAGGTQQPAAVNSGAGASAGFEAVVLSGKAARVSQKGITVNISNTCFGTNLRYVSNPISDVSTIVFYLTLNDKGTLRLFKVKYPAKVVTMNGVSEVVYIPQGDTEGAGLKASYAGNSVRITIPIDFTTKMDEQGNINSDFDVKLQEVRFHQELPSSGNRGGIYGSAWCNFCERLHQQLLGRKAI